MGDRLTRSYRKATWRARCVPDFLIVGCQKGGTSSLHQYLAQHERIVPAEIKEVHYFDGGLDTRWDKFADGPSLYKSYFPRRREIAAISGLTFEASPCYMFNPIAPRRMAALVPSAKLIVLLRDPVERAISHYFHEVRRGRERLPILAALEAESTRLADAVAHANYKDPRWINQSYVARGRYCEQIKRLFSHFDRSQVLIIDSTEFFADPARILHEVLDFVGVGTAGLNIDLRAIGVAKNKVIVPSEAYAFLKSELVDVNRDLEDLVGRKFRWLRL